MIEKREKASNKERGNRTSRRRWDDHDLIPLNWHPFPRHCRRPSLPNGPFVQHKWKFWPPSLLGHWSIRVASCGVAPALQLSVDGSLTLT